MASMLPAFVSSGFVAPFRGTGLSTECRPPTFQNQTRRSATLRISMQSEKKSKKGGQKAKKKAAPVFALDMKGNFVWTLRSATPEDTEAVSAYLKSASSIPDYMIASFIEDSPCCVVCEASVKSPKEGEGFKDQVMGVTIVDVTVEVKDKSVGFSSGLMKRAELLATAVDPELPNVEDVKKKLILGAMKKLKDYGAVSVKTAVPGDDAKAELLRECGFKPDSRSESKDTLVVNLIAENPDPQKKVM